MQHVICRPRANLRERRHPLWCASSLRTAEQYALQGVDPRISDDPPPTLGSNGGKIAPVALPFALSEFTSLMIEYGIIAAPDPKPSRNASR